MSTVSVVWRVSAPTSVAVSFVMAAFEARKIVVHVSHGRDGEGDRVTTTTTIAEKAV